MKVLDESGVKKIVNDYKTADTNIKHDISELQTVIQRLTDRFNSIGFATYGVSNAEGGLAIPLKDGISVCFTIEGTNKPIYGKICIEDNIIIIRNQGSEDDLKNMVATTVGKNGINYLIISEATSSNDIVIKPIIRYNNGEYIAWDDASNESLYVDDVSGDITQIAQEIGKTGTYTPFKFILEGQY